MKVVEEGKKNLLTASSTVFTINNVINDIDFEYEMQKEEFDKLAEPYLRKAI